VYDLLAPKYPRSVVHLDQPGLVVWVNAIDPATGKQVDCQGIRVEFIDEHDDLFGQDTSSWFGGNGFWRVGHVFHAFPRTQRELTFQVTPWRSNETVQVKFPNPYVVTPARWSGQPLPQQKRAGDLEIVLTRLTLSTNGGPKNHWESPARYWESAWELRQGGQPATGWDAPEWISEDPSGIASKTPVGSGSNFRAISIVVSRQPKSSALPPPVMKQAPGAVALAPSRSKNLSSFSFVRF